MNIEWATAVSLKKKNPRKVKPWENIVFFKQMAVAHSIFTLDGWVQLFWAAFDMPMTKVQLKVAWGLGKFDLWSFKKNDNDYFFEMPKKQFFLYPIATFNGTPVTGISKATHKNWTPHVKWILSELQPFV